MSVTDMNAAGKAASYVEPEKSAVLPDNNPTGRATGVNTGMTARLAELKRIGVNVKNIRTFSSFKNSVFRLYYCGMLGQMAAMNMQMIASSLLLYRITGSAAILGAMSLASAIPMTFLSLLGGIIADRFQKKYVMLIGQCCFAAISLGIALALTFGYLSAERPGSWWILALSSVLQGSIMGLMMPSRQAIINDIVTGEELMNAISLNFMGMNTLQIFAPAIAGFLVDLFDFKAVYYTMTGLYIMAIFFFILMPRTTVTEVEKSSALAGIKAGFNYVRRESMLGIILIISLVGVVLSMPYGMMLPIFADDILKVGASGLGIMLSVSGIGAISASITLASLPNRKRGMMMLVSGIILGLALTGFAFSNLWPLSLLLIVFVGISQTVRMAMCNTLLQYYVDDRYRGRVMSLFMMQFGVGGFGTFAVGLIAGAFGVQMAIGSFAVVFIALSILALIVLPKIRSLD